MSDFISAIKRFIEDWVEGKPRLVHYETPQPVDHDKGPIEQRDIILRRVERNTAGEKIAIESTISILIGPGCDLSGKDLSGAQLEGVDLRGANLRGAWLSSANFKGANLSGADFTGARLNFAQMKNAIVDETNFRDAHLMGANLVGVDLSTANMWGTKTLHATVEGANDFYSYLKAFNPDWEPKKK